MGVADAVAGRMSSPEKRSPSKRSASGVNWVSSPEKRSPSKCSGTGRFSLEELSWDCSPEKRSPEKRPGTGRFLEELSWSSSPEKRRPGTGRFNPEELSCLRRQPTPSAHFEQKAEQYWQSFGGMRRTLSDSCMHTLPFAKGQLWRSAFDDHDQESLLSFDFAGSTKDFSASTKDFSASASTKDFGSSANIRPYTPFEEQTAMVLDQIFPKSSLQDSDQETRRQTAACERNAASGSVKKESSKVGSEWFSQPVSKYVSAGDSASNAKSRQTRLLNLRQKLFERFSSMSHAFEAFFPRSTDYKKELTRKQFLHFLQKHFPSLGRNEHERLFELLDADKNQAISMCELHIAMEAAAPVKNLEDLRRRWIALGFTSMRQAISAMDNHCQQHCDKSSSFPSTKRLSFVEFSGALCRVGISEEEEHQALFAFITSATDSATVSLEELASGMASVSPSLLLEDIRDRVLKRHGSLQQAYRAIDVDGNARLSCLEFMQYAQAKFKLSSHEAKKAFQLIDLDGSKSITHTEFMAALKLSEPGLFLEDVRRKVRQRYRSIWQAFGLVAREVESFRRVQNVAREDNRSEGASTNAAAVYPGTEEMALPEFCRVLSSVQLTDADTQLLFELINMQGKNTLTPMEFVRGLRLFAPSCVMEDLRQQCLASYACTRDAFAEVAHQLVTSARRDAVLLDLKKFRSILEDLDLSSGTNAEAIFNLVENRRDGGLLIAELVVALQSAAPGLQVPLLPAQRDAKARQQVRGQLAPFHRSALEVRSEVRQKLSEGDEDDSHQPKWSMAEPKGPVTLLEQRWQSKSTGCLSSSPLLPDVAFVKVPQTSGSPQKFPPMPLSPLSWSSPGIGGPALADLMSPSSPTVDATPMAVTRSLLSHSGSKLSKTHPPTRRSHKKVTQLLLARPPSVFNRGEGAGDPILDRMHDYFNSAGDTMAYDMQLLKNPPRHLQQQIEKVKRPATVPTKAPNHCIS